MQRGIFDRKTQIEYKQVSTENDGRSDGNDCLESNTRHKNVRLSVLLPPRHAHLIFFFILL